MTNATDRHTEGEWSIHVDRNGRAHVGQGDNCTVATLWRPASGDMMANARLVRSAPDLLALARQYASECGECSGSGVSQDTHQDCESCRDIRSVIARATNSEDAK